MNDFIEEAHKLNKKIAVRMPRIFREYIQTEVREDLEGCIKCGIDGFLISTPGHYRVVKDSCREIYLDWTGNVLNSHSASFWQSLGADRVGISPEMSREEINMMRDRSRIEVLAYGYLPLMVTHQCPVGNFAGEKRNRIFCGKRYHPEAYTLRSDSNCFRLDTDCRFCLCTITGAEPLDIREDINFFKVDQFRLDFTTESEAKTAEILKIYEAILSSPDPKCHPAPNLYDKSVL
ncbi:MAG: U32 family peptidase, partial [Anaerolineaceae bacterium]|nr:U32 family peptidase [Anaerolineaceae bacterium]